MIRLSQERFSNETGSNVAPLLLTKLDRAFYRLYEYSQYTPYTVRTFVDAVDGPLERFLPNGDLNPDKDYQYTKTDSSGNAVTIIPYGTQLINAAASLALSSQGSTATLAYDKPSQSWWSV